MQIEGALWCFFIPSKGKDLPVRPTKCIDELGRTRGGDHGGRDPPAILMWTGVPWAFGSPA